MFAVFTVLLCGLSTLVNAKLYDVQDSALSTYSYNDVKKVIVDKNNGEFVEEEAKNAYTCIRDTVINSAFYDDYKVGSEELNFKPMDQIVYLDKEIGYDPDTGKFTKHYDTPSEFNEKVTKAFLGFKDSHQVISFSKSEYNRYSYTLSFVPQPDIINDTTVFRFHKVLDGKYKEKVHSDPSDPNSELVDPSLYFDLYKDYINNKNVDDGYEWTCNSKSNSPEDLENKIIFKIAGIFPDNTLDEELPPLDFFKRYAESENNFSKDIGANIIDSIYRFKSGEVVTTGMPKYKGFKYIIQGENENTYACNIPYVFTNNIVSNAIDSEFSTEFSGDDHGSYWHCEVLIDKYITVSNSKKWVYLSLWLDDNDGETQYKYYAILVLETMQIDMETLREIRMWLTNRKNQITKLIVDVRGNDGGNPAEASYLTSLFNWDIPEPHSRYMRMRPTEYNKNLNFTAVGFKESVYDVYDHKESWLVKELFDDANKTKLNFTNNVDQDKPIIYQSEYTRIFTPRDDDIYLGETYNYSKEGEFYEEILDLDPVDVVIITDGRCGSACATFYWNAFKNKSARIINFGELISESNKEHIIPSAASFAGGQKINKDCSKNNYYNSTIGYIAAKEYLDEYDATPLEFKYGKSDITVSKYSPIYKDMSLRYEYPRTPTNGCTSQKLCCTYDDYYEIIDYPEILDLVKNKVFVNHTSDTYPRIPDARRRKLNETNPIVDIDGNDYVCGRGWDGTDYAGEPVRLYCKAGYYEDQKDHNCRQLPNYETDLAMSEENARAYDKAATDANEKLSDIKESNTVLLAFMIVFCILFVASIVVLLLVLFGVISSPVARASKGKAMVEDVHQIDI